jgi:hypothetical protein
LLDSLKEGPWPIFGAGFPALYAGNPATAERILIKSEPHRVVC